MIKIYKQFNHPDTLLVISSYPDPTTGIRGLDAVAWHSQKTLRSLASLGQKIVVFSEISSSRTKPYLDGKNILILPLWHKNQPLSFFKALCRVFSFTRAKTILFQFEFNIFGGFLPVMFIPFFLSLFRLSGKKIIFEIHQVITDISQLKTHLHLTNAFVQKILNLGLTSFYRAVGLFSHQLVVLEQELKNRLQHFVPAQKITFIPISAIPSRKINQSIAKQKLGFKTTDFVVVSFGFINWYKGSDWLVNAFSQLSSQKNTKLIMAGGPSPTLKDKGHYQNYFSKLEKQINKNKNITLTGFIDDKDVSLYFSAADLMVLPYRIFMSSSGPLSLAFSYKKPVLLSTPLIKNYALSPDFHQSLAQSHLKLSDLSFSLNPSSFPKKIAQAKINIKQLTRFSGLMQNYRSQNTVSKTYLNLINSGKINHVLAQTLSYQTA